MRIPSIPMEWQFSDELFHHRQAFLYQFGASINVKECQTKCCRSCISVDEKCINIGWTLIISMQLLFFKYYTLSLRHPEFDKWILNGLSLWNVFSFASKVCWVRWPTLRACNKMRCKMGKCFFARGIICSEINILRSTCSNCNLRQRDGRTCLLARKKDMHILLRNF